jgi:hypothetical protein
MGWLEVDLGNFRTTPLCVRVVFWERERMSGWDLPPWASIIVIILYGTYRRST